MNNLALSELCFIVLEASWRPPNCANKTISKVIDELPLGHPDRLLLMLYTSLKFPGAFQHSGASLLHLGRVLVYTPVQYNNAPTPERRAAEVGAWAAREDGPRGFVILHKNPKLDIVYLLLGLEIDKDGDMAKVARNFRVPLALSTELRAYLANRDPSIKYLFTESRFKDPKLNGPYSADDKGRSSWNARVNRLLHAKGLGNLRTFRLAIMKHHQAEAQKDLLQS